MAVQIEFQEGVRIWMNLNELKLILSGLHKIWINRGKFALYNLLYFMVVFVVGLYKCEGKKVSCTSKDLANGGSEHDQFKEQEIP